MSEPVFNVLFLCTGNSARSIMAEALLHHLGSERFHAFSAGSFPTGTVNPYALKRLEIEGMPLENARSKSWDEFSAPDAPVMDLIITVCDNAAGEICPAWPGHPLTAHWGVFDPAAAEEERKHLAFAEAYAILRRRVELLVNLQPSALERLALQTKVREIGKDGSG